MTFGDAERDAILEWITPFDCFLEMGGEVGFGRPCVGIKQDDAYVDTALPYHMYDSHIELYREHWNALPPSPRDAYHKHDCLAVLVHDSDYPTALCQLYDWCMVLKHSGWTIATEGRRTHNEPGSFGAAIELAMGGFTQARLVMPNG